MSQLDRRAVLQLLAVGAGARFVFAHGQPQSLPSQRLYVTNSMGSDITLIDLATLKPVGALKVGKHPHGVAARGDGRRSTPRSRWRKT